MPTKPKRPKKPKALKPITQMAEPNERRVYFTVKQTAGVRVNEDTALTYSAVWGCVRFIAESLASLPLRHMKDKPGGGAELIGQSPVDWITNTQANPETTAYQWRVTTLAHALTWGNGYSEIETDLAGRPVWVWQLTPDRVRVERTQRGQIVYDIANPRQSNTVLLPENIVHVKGLGFDGLIGYSVISYAAKSIGAAIASDESASTYFGNDATPGGVLKHPRRLSDAARKQLLEDWQKRHGGAVNRRTVALLEEGLEWQQTGLPPQDSQMIENRQFGPVDISRWFRVPPHKIGILDRATFSNIEQQEIQSVIDCLLPWAICFEQELNIKLFGRTSRSNNYFKHNFKGRLRGDAQMRAGFYQTMMDRGVFSINDVLDLEDMNPIGPDGDKRFVQRNMITLDQAGMPELAPATSPPVDNTDSPEDTPEEETPKETPPEPMSAQTLLYPIIEDAMKRILRREAKVASGFFKSGKPAGEWVNDLSFQQESYIKDALQPSLAALSQALGSNVIEATLKAFFVKYLDEMVNRCNKPTAEPTENLSEKYANMLIQVAFTLAGAL